MRITRRSMLQVTASAALVSGFGARAQTAEFTYKYANNLPAAHPMNMRAAEAAERIKQQSGGRVVIQIFPNNQLGSDTDMLSQVRAGGVEFFTLSPLILSTLVPNASLSGIGFAFPGYDAVWKAMDGELGAYVRGQIGKANLVVMDKIWDNGFRQITSSNKPIQTRGRPEGIQDPRAGQPALDVDVHRFRIRSCQHQLRGSLHRVADESGRRTGEPARHHLHGEALRGAEILLDDEPHVGWLLVPRQPSGMGTAAGGSPRHRCKEPQRGRRRRACRRRQAQCGPQGRACLQGHDHQRAGARPFREALRKAGFYAEWKKKYGDEAWAILEKAVGSPPELITP